MLATALAAGCAHQASTAIDPTLPESDAARDRGTAVEILTRAADDAEPGPRGRALGLLIRASREPGGGEWGARALWDPDAWVQREAVHALAERLPEPASRDLLIDYVGRDTAEPYVRGSAALALARSGSTDTRDALAAAWRAEPAPWRAAPLQLAAAVLGDAEAIEPLARTIASGELPLEVDFVLDVGTSGLAPLLAALREGADLVEEELTLPYAAATVGLGDPSGEGALRQALGDADVLRRMEALDYIVRLDDPVAMSLLKRARNQGPDVVRWYAELGLAARGDGPVDLVERGLSEDDPEVRVLAAHFAAAIAGRGDVDRKSAKALERAVQASLDDPDPNVQIELLRALEMIGGDASAEVVVAALTNDTQAVRIEAAGLLVGKEL